MFRRATAEDRIVLDRMTLAGVRHWGHHESHPAVYAGLAEHLNAEPSPETQLVYVLEEHGEAVAFYELRDRGDHIELLRMFMRTDLIGQGYGRMLWNHAVSQASQTQNRLLIMSDPGATDFYAAMGAELERSQQVAPGFSLGVYWYDLERA